MNDVAELTVEEQAVADAVRVMYEKMAACAEAGGDPNRAYIAATPSELLEEVKRQVPFLSFLGF